MSDKENSDKFTNSYSMCQVVKALHATLRPPIFYLEDSRHQIRPSQQMLSACFGGLLTTFVVTPLDVVKTRVQTEHTRNILNNSAIRKCWYVFRYGLLPRVCKPDSKNCARQVLDDIKIKQSRGSLDVFLKVVCNDGFFALWSGLGPTLVSALPSTMLYFVSYDYVKQYLANAYIWYKTQPINFEDDVPIRYDEDPILPAVNMERVPFLVPLMAGVLARSFVVTIVTPVEMVRIKMQSQRTTYKEMKNIIRKLIEAQGVRVLWRGLPPTLMRDAPFSGVYWASYEMMKRVYGVDEPSFFFSFTAGAAAGAVATVATMPADLITTYTQLELGQKTIQSDTINKPTLRDRLLMVYRKKGINGLFVGIIPRMMRVMPACAIMISTFEYSKSFFARYNASLEAQNTDVRLNVLRNMPEPVVVEDRKKPLPIMTDPRFSIRPSQQVASACTGAMITACFMTPLDVIKTRIQAQQSTFISNKCFLYCNGLMDHLCPCGPTSSTQTTYNKPAPHFSGTIDAFLKISRNEGISSLWSGLGPTLISALPSTIIYFVAYEQFKARFLSFHYQYFANVKGSPMGREIPCLVPLLAGVTARICAVTFVSPIELIRTKMQSQKMTYAQISSSVHNVIATHGIKGLWRGLPPTILRDVPFSGIYWTCYEYLKSRFNVTEPSFGFSFVAGAISGTVAAMVTTPFDVIKTHDQIEFGEKVIFAENPPKSLPSRSAFSRLLTIYRLNGLRGIFAGLGPRLFKVAPACAIMISTFEYSKSFFYHYNVDQHNQALLLNNPNANLVKHLESDK